MTNAVAIIGGGFSGFTIAYHLYHLSQKPIRILIFEAKYPFGLGEAYSTKNPLHLLNVAAGNMSFFPDRPDHFVNWVRSDLIAKKFIDQTEDLEAQFLPRLVYGRYLKNLLSELNHPSSRGAQVEFYHKEVMTIDQNNQQQKIKLNDHTEMSVNKTVLAIGNLPPLKLHIPGLEQNIIENPWNENVIKNIPADKNILIVGTGLTMIDVVLTLLHQNHRGLVYAVSRRGQLPQRHKQIAMSYQINRLQIPRSLQALVQYIQNEIAELERAGGDWREVIDALRPCSQSLWQNFSLKEKRSFLEHLQPFWNSHRHRVAQRVEDVIATARFKGQLQILAGKLLGYKNGKIAIKSRRDHKNFEILVDHVINCSGPNANYLQADSPLVQSLLKQGLVSTDKLNLGFNSTKECRIVDKKGEALRNLFTLGPPCKGMLWECTAVPEIRVQGLQLAHELNGSL